MCQTKRSAFCLCYDFWRDLEIMPWINLTVETFDINLFRTTITFLIVTCLGMHLINIWLCGLCFMIWQAVGAVYLTQIKQFLIQKEKKSNKKHRLKIVKEAKLRERFGKQTSIKGMCGCKLINWVSLVLLNQMLWLVF